MNIFALSTIRGRLIAGFLLLVGLLVVAGVVGRLAISAFSVEIAITLTAVRRETALTASLNAFNVSNHKNYSNYSGVLGSGFGQAHQAQPPRRMQLNVEFTF